MYLFLLIFGFPAKANKTHKQAQNEKWSTPYELLVGRKLNNTTYSATCLLTNTMAKQPKPKGKNGETEKTMKNEEDTNTKSLGTNNWERATINEQRRRKIKV